MSTNIARKHKYTIIFFPLSIIILTFILINFNKYRKNQRASEIFLIEETSLSLGQTTITGILQKDSPTGKTGTYLLVLPDSRPVILDIVGLDNLVGKRVNVTGNLTPSSKAGLPLSMTVSEITTY